MALYSNYRRYSSYSLLLSSPLPTKKSSINLNVLLLRNNRPTINATELRIAGTKIHLKERGERWTGVKLNYRI